MGEPGDSLMGSLLELVVRGQTEFLRLVVAADAAERAHDAFPLVVLEEVAGRVAVQADEKLDFVAHGVLPCAFRLASRRRPAPPLRGPHDALRRLRDRSSAHGSRPRAGTPDGP